MITQVQRRVAKQAKRSGTGHTHRACALTESSQGTMGAWAYHPSRFLFRIELVSVP